MLGEEGEAGWSAEGELRQHVGRRSRTGGRRAAQAGPRTTPNPEQCEEQPGDLLFVGFAPLAALLRERYRIAVRWPAALGGATKGGSSCPCARAGWTSNLAVCQKVAKRSSWEGSVSETGLAARPTLTPSSAAQVAAIVLSLQFPSSLMDNERIFNSQFEARPSVSARRPDLALLTALVPPSASRPLRPELFTYPLYPPQTSSPPNGVGRLVSAFLLPPLPRAPLPLLLSLHQHPKTPPIPLPLLLLRLPQRQ